MAEGKKREVNGTLKQLLELDKRVTKQFVELANKCMPARQLKVQYKMLELSCHGIPWFACWLAFMWLISSPSLIQMQINMLLGMIIDIIVVGLIKAITRRRRPLPNTDDPFGRYGPDKFSFPSGHTTRSVFIAYFFINLYPLHVIFWMPLMAWCFSVSISRLLMYRHHILDVAAGAMIGLMNGILIGWIWLGQDACEYIYNVLSDERLEGPAHHI